MDASPWQSRFQQEITRAETARAEGNEGMARVCARRAAGVVTGEYFTRIGLPPSGPSAFERLKALRHHPDVTPEVREAAEHFLVRITTEHELPVEADLIAEARWLAQELLQEQT